MPRPGLEPGQDVLRILAGGLVQLGESRLEGAALVPRSGDEIAAESQGLGGRNTFTYVISRNETAYLSHIRIFGRITSLLFCTPNMFASFHFSFTCKPPETHNSLYAY